MSHSEQPLLLIIAGPTSSGKSSLALGAARALQGEIVNCDSMQLIREMDLGTAKPSQEEQEAVPHHLYDRINPDEYFSAGTYMAEARDICSEITGRGKVPIVVGGTGLYLSALLYGVFDGPGKSEELRARLSRVEEGRGLDYLHRWLARVDPDSGAKITAQDRLRIVRALEVYLLTGEPISRLQNQREELAGYRIVKAGIRLSRETLYGRINERVEWMFGAGLLEEVAGLLDRGYPPTAKGFEALGYRHAIQVLLGALTMEEAVELTQRDTRRYAKRQMTWFRREGLSWIDGPGERPGALTDLLKLVSGENTCDAI